MSVTSIRLPGRARGALSARRRRWPTSLVVGVAIVVAAAVLALLGPLLLPDPNHQDLLTAALPPLSAGHPLGTDALGRDVLAWIASSIRISALVAVSVVTVAALVGVAVGLLAGYVGGAFDALLMRLVDLQLAIPPLLLFICAASVVGRSLLVIIVLLAIPSWVPYARVVRTRVLVERERASVAAARLAGASHLGVLVRELLPATRSLVIVLASLQLGWILLWETALSFVGIGVHPPSTSFGYMIAQGRDALAQQWWVVAFPGLVLALLVLASNLIGDGLGEQLDVEVEVTDA
ncbi:MAG TPA: ABC transporter permease [Conexibacter sp.]|jgi:peptide/nickel transport system permease protein|nr:ABC transporter permease [Conexibacter sp.]